MESKPICHVAQSRIPRSMIAVDENLCGIRLPALRRDIVCDVTTVRLVLAALGADVYAGSQYGVSTNNLSQRSVKKRNVICRTQQTNACLRLCWTHGIGTTPS